MGVNDLQETAKALVADNKGILAADESSGTIKKRFDSISLESTEETRRAYRDMLFTTPGLEESVSGVILYDETLRQSSADGTPFAQLLAGKGIIPGIKVDTGAKELAGAPGEKVTEGLDGLRERLCSRIDLDPRDDPLVGKQLRERRPLRRALPDRFVVEDDAADRVLQAGCGEEHVAVGAPVLLRRLEADRVEALLDRAGALVGGEDPLVVGHQGRCCLVQLSVGAHRALLSSSV